MKFFSAFGLKNEQELFRFWLNCNDFCVAGFSSGAIDALEYTLNSKNRVDRLILISPIFFESIDRDELNKRVKIFKKRYKKFMSEYYKKIDIGSRLDIAKYKTNATLLELENALFYNWSIEKLEKIIKRGTVVEVILSQDDKISDSKYALYFFKDITTTYLIKDVNHLLKRI